MDNELNTDNHCHQHQHAESTINDSLSTEVSIQHEVASDHPQPVEKTQTSVGSQQNCNPNNNNVEQAPPRRSQRISKARDLFADSAHSSL